MWLVFASRSGGALVAITRSPGNAAMLWHAGFGILKASSAHRYALDMAMELDREVFT